MENTSLRSPPSPRRRRTLIAGLALLVLALPVAWHVGQVVANALAPYGGVLVMILVVFVVLFGLALLRIAFAFGRRLEAQARQAEIVSLPNGMPVHLLDVAPLAARLAPHTLDRHYDVELERAGRASLYPSLTSLHQTMHGAPPVLAAPAAALVLPGPSGGTLPDLAEAIADGASSPDHWLAGYGADDQPQQIVLKHACFIAIAGVQGTGKTNTAAYLAAQAAYHGGDLLVSDIHYGDDESLATRIAPFSGAVARWATTAEETNDLILLADKIYQRRCADSGQATTTVLLIIDEFMELMIRGLISDAAMTALLVFSGGGRKKHMQVALIAQNWSERLLGRYGVAVRQNVTHALVHRSSQETADFLLPGSSYARQAATAAPGQIVFFGGGEPLLVAVPWLSDADLRYAARGRPTRQYQPRATQAARAPAPPIPPTTRVTPPRQAPPTERLPEPTVQQQIVLLLAGRRDWLTSGEITAALGVDPKVVQTELKELFDQRAIVRREVQRKVREKFEYAVNQSINAPFAVSA